MSAPRPTCSFRWCGFDAAWAVPDYLAESTGSPEFMCEHHFAEYSKFMCRPTPGLDPPKGASDFWRPSIVGMIQLAGMEIRRQERAKQAPVFMRPELPMIERERRWTPQQRAQAEFVRRQIRR